jgi:hypothetical protein
MKKAHFLLIVILISLSSGVLMTGCSKTAVSTNSVELAMASMDGMPDSVKEAPATVQQAYQFAVANSDTMKQIPCYCGCGAMGHTSNYSCYIQADSPNKELAFDEHALGCGICVDITQDTMRLMRQGKSISDIRSYIDSTYSQYGPSNMEK